MSSYDASWLWRIPGGIFEEITVKLFEFNGYTVNMNVKCIDYGQVGYFFTIKCPEDKKFEEVKVADIVPVLRPAYNVAGNINTATEIVGTLIILLAALVGSQPSVPEVMDSLTALFNQLSPII